MDFLDIFYVSIDMTNRLLFVPISSGEVEGLVKKIISYSKLHKVVSVTKFDIPPRSVSHVKVNVKYCNVSIDGCIKCLEKDSSS